MKLTRKSKNIILIFLSAIVISCCVAVAIILNPATKVYAATNANYSFDDGNELKNFIAISNTSDDGVDGVEEDFGAHWHYDSTNGYVYSDRLGSGDTNTKYSTSLVFKKYIFENFEAEISMSFNSATWGWGGLQFRKNITTSGYVSDGGIAFVQREGKATINGSNDFIQGNPIEANSVSGEFDPSEPFLLYVRVVGVSYTVKVMSTDKTITYSIVSGYFNNTSSVRGGYLALTSIDNSHRFYDFNVKNLDASGELKALVANSTKEYSFDSVDELEDFTSVYSDPQQSNTATEQDYTSRWTLGNGKITSVRPSSGSNGTDKAVSLLLNKYKFTNFSASIAMSFNNTDGSWGWGGLQFRKTNKLTGWRYDACLAFAQLQGYSSLFGCDDFDNTIVTDEEYDFSDASFTGTNYFILNVKVVGRVIDISVSLNGITYTSLSYSFTKSDAVRLGYLALTSIDNSHDYFAFKVTNLDNEGNPAPLVLESGSVETSPFEPDPNEESEYQVVHNWIYENITETAENTVTYEFDSQSEMSDFTAIACKDEYGEGAEVAISGNFTLANGKVSFAKQNLGGSDTGNVLSLVLNKYDFRNFKAEIVMDFNTISADANGSWGWGGLQFRKTNIYYGWNIKGAFAFAQEGGKATVWGSQEYIFENHEGDLIDSSFNAKSQFKLSVKVVGTICAVEISSVDGSTIYSNIMYNLDGSNPIKTGFVALTSVNNSHDFYSLKLTNLDDSGNPIALVEYHEATDSPDTTDFYYNFTAMSLDEIGEAFYTSYIRDEHGGGAHPIEDYFEKTSTGTIKSKVKSLTTKDSAKNMVNLYFKQFKTINFEATVVYRDTNPLGKGYMGFVKNYKTTGWRFFEDGMGAFLQRDGIATVWGENIEVSEDYTMQSTYDLTKWHTLKIRAYNGKVEFYLDGSSVFATRTGVSQDLGYLGLMTTSNSVFEIKGIDFRHLDNSGNELSYKGISLSINNKITTAVSGAGQSHALNISGTSQYHIVSSDVNVAFVTDNTVYFCTSGTVTITVICDQDASIKDSMTIAVS